MDRFSSCYFCGGALDVSLSEYPVVPREFQSPDGDDSTVVLCSTCREKLGAVVEEVVAATAEEPTTEDDDATLPGEWESPTTSGTADDASADSAAETGSETTSADSTDADAEATGDSARADDTDTSDDDGADTSDGESSGQTDDDGADTSDDESSGQTDDDGPTMTKLEYNKVMRLLQNREFPVERAEIRDVATSAYGIDRSEFETVIDAAVDRGLLAERDGQFVEPE